MELEGLSHSLMNKSIGIIVKNEIECYIPWEFLHSPDSYTHRLLITNKSNKYKNLLVGNDWSSIWNIGNPKDWSCIATTLKAHTGHLLLVFDINIPDIPNSFINFIQNLIEHDHKSITTIRMIQLGQPIYFHDAIFWTVGHDPTNIYATITHLITKYSHIKFGYEYDVVENLVNAANKENAELVMSYEGAFNYKLYWSKKEDSFLDHSELTKKAHSFIRSSMNLIDHL
jgi:hypothetical protein